MKKYLRLLNPLNWFTTKPVAVVEETLPLPENQTPCENIAPLAPADQPLVAMEAPALPTVTVTVVEVKKPRTPRKKKETTVAETAKATKPKAKKKKD